MASDYSYIIVADLEAYHGDIDYDAQFGLDDGVVEANISLAERNVNKIKRTSYSGTIPDFVKSATLLMAKRLMNNLIIEFGYGSEGEEQVKVIDDVVLGILSDTSTKYDYKLIKNVTSWFLD